MRMLDPYTEFYMRRIRFERRLRIGLMVVMLAAIFLLSIWALDVDAQDFWWRPM